MEKKCGIYKITSPSNKIYIGQSVDIKKRWKDCGSKKSCDIKNEIGFCLPSFESYDAFIAGYNEAQRWISVEEAPQNTVLIAKYQLYKSVMEYTLVEKDCEDNIHWRGKDWDIETYPIILCRPI